MVAAFHKVGPRGDPRRRLQPHRRGRRRRTRAYNFPRASQQHVLHARRRRPGSVPQLRRVRQRGQQQPPHRPVADPFLPAEHRSRVGRQPAPGSTSPSLSSGATTGGTCWSSRGHRPDPPRTRWPSWGKMIAEPWDADQENFQVGNFPGGHRWSVWNGQYRDDAPRFWQGEPGIGDLRAGDPALRVGRRLPRGRPGAAPLDQLHHLPRRLHPGRPRLLQREAQRDQRRGEPRRLQLQLLLELRRRGPDHDPETRPALAPQRNLLTTLLMSQGVPMLLGGDEFSGRRAATITPGARTTRSPGFTGTSTSTAGRCSSSRSG